LSELAFDQLLRRLADARAEFVVVGGLALSAWGVVRGTKDVDVVVATDAENPIRVAEVAVAAGGHVQQDFLGRSARSKARLLRLRGTVGALHRGGRINSAPEQN
jgi:hypothetical protein